MCKNPPPANYYWPELDVDLGCLEAIRNPERNSLCGQTPNP